MMAIACALLSGVMFYLSVGLDNVWWLAFLAPTPLLWLAYGPTPGWRSFLAGFFAYGCGQIYLFQCYGDAMSPLRLGIPAAGAALLCAVSLLFARAAWRRLPHWAALFAFPALWTALEWLTGLRSPDGSFGSLAYAVVSFPAVLQIASLFGLYAITFTICLIANSLAMIARGERIAGSMGVVLFALVLAFGFIRLAEPQQPPVKVAAVADLDTGPAWGNGRLPEASLTTIASTYAAQVRKLARQGVRVVAIPEAAIPVTSEWQGTVLAPLAAAAKDTNTLVVTGTLTRTPPLNRAFAFSSNGAVHIYAKRHPLRPLEREVAGTKAGLIGNGRAMAVCKDLDFPRTIRGDAEQGLHLMIVPASDFGFDGWIHGRMAIMRGVENGFAILRSAFKGLETASDAEGRVLAHKSTLGHGMVVMTAALPPGPGPTLYTRIGDLFAWICIAIAALMAGAMVVRAHRIHQAFLKDSSP